MEINPIKTTTLNFGQSNSGNVKQDVAATFAPKANNAEKDPVTDLQRVTDVTAAEKGRLDNVIKAARQLSNYFVVSDTTFTIFKDSSGQFVTRFTNLKDGSVTYIPEPAIQDFIASASERRVALQLDV